jgi:hypothetical protein
MVGNSKPALRKCSWERTSVIIARDQHSPAACRLLRGKRRAAGSMTNELSGVFEMMHAAYATYPAFFS